MSRNKYTKRESGFYILSSYTDERIKKTMNGSENLRSALMFFIFVLCANPPLSKHSTRKERTGFRKSLVTYFDSIGLDGEEAGKLFIKIKRRT